MIGVLSDSRDESVTNILLKCVSIDVVIITLTEVFTNSLDAALVDGVGMLKNEPIILIGADIMIVSGFAVSLLCSADVLADTWAGPFMKPIGARIEAVVEALTELINICVVSGIGADELTDVDVNVLWVMITELGLTSIAVSALLP